MLDLQMESVFSKALHVETENSCTKMLSFEPLKRFAADKIGKSAKHLGPVRNYGSGLRGMVSVVNLATSGSKTGAAGHPCERFLLI